MAKEYKAPSPLLIYATKYAIKVAKMTGLEENSIDLLFMGLLKTSELEVDEVDEKDELRRLKRYVAILEESPKKIRQMMREHLPKSQDAKEETKRFVKVLSQIPKEAEQIEADVMFEVILGNMTELMIRVLFNDGKKNDWKDVEESLGGGKSLGLDELLAAQNAIRIDMGDSQKDFKKDPQKEPAAGGGEVNIADLVSFTRNLRENLLKKIHGQNHAVSAFVDGIWNSELVAASDKERYRPRGLFVFAGPPGVGKTFLAQEAAREMAIPFLRLDMSAYADNLSANGLTGNDKIYSNAKRGVLTQFVSEHPRCVVLFDEIEKAHINVIHLFLQILDEGILTDNYTGERVAFKDATIIFTTNAGRGIYEDPDFKDAAAYPQKKVLEALEKDINPATKMAYFPEAIISRMATGYPVMFNHLEAHYLEMVCKGEFEKVGTQIAKTYKMQVEADESVYASLLFAEGGKSDARGLTAKTGAFVRNEIRKLFDLFADDNIESTMKDIEKIVFTADISHASKDVMKLYENAEDAKILILGREHLSDRIANKMSGYQFFYAATQAEAEPIIVKNDIQLVLVQIDSEVAKITRDYKKTIAFFDYVPVGASSLSMRRKEIIDLHKANPDLPLYILETDYMKIDRELELALMQDGARGIVHMEYRNLGEFAEEIKSIASALYMQKMAEYLKNHSKLLHFETTPIIDKEKKKAQIRIRDYKIEQIVSLEDQGEEIQDAEQIKTRFADVIGADSAKDELRFFVDYLKNPKKFAAQGLCPPKGVLLYGDPGTGKTMLAKAMAGEANVAFFSTEASSFVNKYVGTGPDAVRKLFAKARKYAPAVVFIDEIDTIGRKRTGGESGRAEESTLTALLTEMDGFRVDPKRPVFVLAATNYSVEQGDGIGEIDPALARRFDRKIRVNLPDKNGRYQFLSLQFGKFSSKVSDNMLKSLADRSVGMSLADLTNVIELAKRTASKAQSLITDEILDESYEVTMHGEKKDWGIEYLERVARHEAGHAVMSWIAGEKPSYLTIVARGSHGGYMQKSSDRNPLSTRAEMLAKIRTALGGRAAELVYYGMEGGISTGASGDLSQATAVAKYMICQCGMDDELGLAVYSEKEMSQGFVAEMIYKKINEILKREPEDTKNTLEKNRSKIDTLVKQLLEKNQLGKDEIDQIMKK
ncbi:MAG: AAA family ATPase [Clostridia bacterium]|nr:AAA family ATPase [Clostridia bacterium]